MPRYVYGHVFVVLGLLVTHKAWGTIALPLLARLYVRKKDLPAIDPKHRPAFCTKLELAVEMLRWAKPWLGLLGKPIWVVADGAYAKKDFLKPAAALGMTVISRLRKDAALRTLPGPRPAGKRGRPRTYIDFLVASPQASCCTEAAAVQPESPVEQAQVRAARAQRNHIGLTIRAFLRLEHHFYTTGVSW